jgi:hypothetical protein
MIKKLFCFAIAVSLWNPCFGGEDLFLGDFEEIGSESVLDFSLTGGKKLSPWREGTPEPLEKKKFDLASDPIKGQEHSMIDWNSLDQEKWLNIGEWILEDEIKSKTPDWVNRIRDDRQLELVGKILSCRGQCPVYRGLMPVSGQHLSQIVEGDEIRTEKDSVAWIFLMDGTLVRLAPESSFSFQEINFSKNEIFLKARLNKGHVFWHSRSREEYALELSPETDAYALPLRVLEANQQFFERKIFNEQDDSSRLAEILELDESAIRSQISKLNELRQENNKIHNKISQVMLVVPNVTLSYSDATVDVAYTPGGKSYFKKRWGKEVALNLRGYGEHLKDSTEESAWYEIEENGRSFSKIDDVSPTLQLLELMTKRIKSLELAREIWVSHFTLPILNMMEEPKKLAIEFGYTFWEEEILKKRQEFLIDYSRRSESSNLKSINNLLEKLALNGEKVNRDLSQDLYQFPLNYYLKGLKKRYTVLQTQVRQMSDLQYYVWTLKNGKL